MNEVLQGLATVALFLMILGGLVLVHELGHFITARLAGVRVLEFGIGFPPRAKVLRSKGETLYTLNWLPIGGFVKLEGEDGDEVDDPRSFARAGLPTKLVILAAGVVMNLLTAFLIFTLIALLATPVVGVRFFEVQPDSPAAAAGLRPGETIVAIDGGEFEFFGPIDPLTSLRSRAGETVRLTIESSVGARRDVTVTLRPQAEAGTRGALGIGGQGGRGFEFPIHYRGHDPATALARGADDTVRWFGVILAGLGDLARSFGADPTAPPPVSGPVGIATQIGDVFFGFGPILTLYVAGILSANLALVNSLPFPPLDGGRALMLVLKATFGSRISLRAERLTYVVGFVFLFAFLIWVTSFDLLRMFGAIT